MLVCRLAARQVRDRQSRDRDDSLSEALASSLCFVLFASKIQDTWCMGRGCSCGRDGEQVDHERSGAPGKLKISQRDRPPSPVAAPLAGTSHISCRIAVPGIICFCGIFERIGTLVAVKKLQLHHHVKTLGC